MSDIQVLTRQRAVLVAFSVHSPVPFALELYSLDGNCLAKNVASELEPAFKDSEDNVSFYNPRADRLRLVETAITLKQG